MRDADKLDVAFVAVWLISFVLSLAVVGFVLWLLWRLVSWVVQQ